MDLPGPFGSRDIGRVVMWVFALSVAAGCMGSDPVNDRLAAVPPGAQVSTLTGRLWIHDEAGNCTSTISTFFPCLLANTSFNQLTSAFSNGEVSIVGWDRHGQRGQFLCGQPVLHLEQLVAGGTAASGERFENSRCRTTT